MPPMMPNNPAALFDRRQKKPMRMDADKRRGQICYALLKIFEHAMCSMYGAISPATISENSDTVLPTATMRESGAWRLISFAYTSSEKIVAVEFTNELIVDITAAKKPVSTIPRKPHSGDMLAKTKGKAVSAFFSGSAIFIT